MNTRFLRRIFERMHDRTLASAIAAGAAGTDGEVSERTVRNWLEKRTTPDPETLAQLAAGSRDNLLKRLEAKAWPAAAREAFGEAVEACPGFVSAFATSLQNGGAKYPAFIALAGQVDRLELALDGRRADDDLQGWVATLLQATWILDEHLVNPDGSADAAATRRQLLDAKSWEDLALPAAIFVVNVQLQLLATLDLEFCSSYLSDWRATPIFASLLPRLHPKAAFVGTHAATRDLFQYPTRRLLDITACLRSLRNSPSRAWPCAVPSAGEMAAWLDLAGQEKLASNLPKWRSGRTLTAARFEDLWEACFSFVPEADRPAAPLPMLYAVTVFTELFVKGSREDHNLTFITPDLAMYQRWWEMQHQALAKGAQPLSFGKREWMPGPN